MNKKSRGNAIAEAMAAGALVISNHNVVNRDVIYLSNTLVDSFESLLDLVTDYETHPEKYYEALEGQKKIFNFLSFDRPLYQLLERSQAVYNFKN